MRDGIVGIPAHEERAELSFHYDQTKDNFDTTISFCNVCIFTKEGFEIHNRVKYVLDSVSNELS